MDIYIHLLKNFCGNSVVQEENVAIRNSVEVNQSFSVTVGKTIRSHDVVSRMGVIYNVLNTRLVDFCAVASYTLSSSVLACTLWLYCP